MRIAIFGAGGVGGYLGGRLVQSGEDVTFIARGRHLAALQADGLRLSSPQGDAHLPGVRATDDPLQVGVADVVLVTLKTWQLPEALVTLPALVGPETLVLPLLNGVEASDQIATAVDEAAVLQGAIRILSYIESPGHIRHLEPVPIVDLGERGGGRTARVKHLASVLGDSGITVRVPDDIAVALWSKFLLVVSTGGVGAVTRAPFGIVRSLPETRAMMEEAMQEIFSVGRARGVDLPASAVDDALRFVDSLPEEGTTSLHRDIAGGRRSELDAWNGAVVRLGRDAGVPTPVHEGIYRSLLPMELQAQGRVTW